jgi:hypothetical protein
MTHDTSRLTESIIKETQAFCLRSRPLHCRSKNQKQSAMTQHTTPLPIIGKQLASHMLPAIGKGGSARHQYGNGFLDKPSDNIHNLR